MKVLLAALVLLAVCSGAAGQLKEADLLEPERAFSFSAQAVDGAVLVQFRIADGYYMYRERFRFSAEGGGVRLGAPEFPRGLKHRDDFFGETETYRK